MSKLIDFFNQVSQANAQTMGFLSRRSAPPPKRLALIAVTGVPAGAFPGADAVLVRPDKAKLTAAAAREVGDTLGEVPWGTMDGAPRGADFTVVRLTGLTAGAPTDGATGRLLELETSLDDGLLRAVNDLPVDAAVAADALEESGPLTWHRLMILAHVRHLITKPVVVPVATDISEADVKSLWDAGFDGIMVAAPAERIAALAETIAALPPRAVPKKKTEAVVPRADATPAQAAAEPEEEPDEDDDWE